MRPALALSVHRSDGTARIVVTGELDLAGVPRLSALLHEHRGLADAVVLDLSGLDFLDSSGIGAVLDGCRLADGRMTVVAPTGQPLRALVLCGLLDELPWEPAGVAAG